MKLILLMFKCQQLISIGRINTSYESLKAGNTYLFQHFHFYEQFHAHLSWAWKKFYNLEICFPIKTEDVSKNKKTGIGQTSTAVLTKSDSDIIFCLNRM